MANSLDEGSNVSDEIAYVPVRVLGRGAFGKAVLYRRLNDGMLVVWKELNVSPFSERNRKEAFNEIEILSALNHINIIKYLNHFFDNDVLCIELEYANGGSLYDKIVKHENNDSPLSEIDILWYFYQLMCAVVYIHSLGILHRDIKSLNIFLTKTDVLKLGDFGISKALASPDDFASSCVGTPFYMSPEIVRGENYDFKSDVWACGCVIYELTTLRRAFNATNALRLAREIVSTDVSMDIDLDNYSLNLKNTLRAMLNKDRQQRISAIDVLQQPMFSNLKANFDERLLCAVGLANEIRRPSSSASTISIASSFGSSSVPVITSTSVTTELYLWGGGKNSPQLLEPFSGGSGRPVICVAAGPHHFAAITMEGEVYTWVDGTSCQSVEGELGHGDLTPHRIARKIPFFENTLVSQVSCGEYFTVCVTNSGNLYSFGSNTDGCLGLGESVDCAIEPMSIINFNLDTACGIPNTTPAFRSVVCGDKHVLAITTDGRLFTWGAGEFGPLGHGNEDDCFLPREVNYLPPLDPVVVCAASVDASMIVLQSGILYATGSNEYNKLGFSTSLSGFEKGQTASFDIPFKLKFSIVKPLKSHVAVDVSMGKTHSVCIDATGLLITFGDNRYGQLGQGDCKPRSTSICRVLGPLVGHEVVSAVAGDGFTVASLANGALFSWGKNSYGQLGQAAFGVPYSSIPNPVALPSGVNCRRISAISARSWHTIAVVESVHNQKTMKHGGLLQSRSSVASSSVVLQDIGSSSGIDSNDAPVKFGISSSSGSFRFNSIAGKDVFDSAAIHGEESAVPEWLQKEFEEAQMNSIKPDIKDPPVPVNEVVPAVVTEEPTIDFVKRIEELEHENQRLRAIVAEHESVISELRKSLTCNMRDSQVTN